MIDYLDYNSYVALLQAIVADPEFQENEKLCHGYAVDGSKRADDEPIPGEYWEYFHNTIGEIAAHSWVAQLMREYYGQHFAELMGHTEAEMLEMGWEHDYLQEARHEAIRYDIDCVLSGHNVGSWNMPDVFPVR